MTHTVLIPARLHSTRLPEKPLADIAGIPMVVRVARATYLGREMQYTLDTPVGELFAVSHDLSQVFTQGTSVAMTVHEHGAAIIGGQA